MTRKKAEAGWPPGEPRYVAGIGQWGSRVCFPKEGQLFLRLRGREASPVFPAHAHRLCA